MIPKKTSAGLRARIVAPFGCAIMYYRSTGGAETGHQCAALIRKDLFDEG
jgi:hypothetical protein